jgi:dienelactone hydrolase
MRAVLKAIVLMAILSGAFNVKAEGNFKERMAKVPIHSQNWPVIEKETNYALEAASTDAEKLKALLMLNLCHAKMNRRDLAFQDVDTASALNPEDPADLPELAGKLMDYCQYDKALKISEKIMGSPASTPEMKEKALLIKAQAFERQDMNEKAKEAFAEIANSPSVSAGAKEKAKRQLDLLGKLITPKQLWADFDPDKGEFKEEIIKEETKGGIYSKESFVSAYVLGEEVRVYCMYKVKAGATKAPGLLNVHGYMSYPSINMGYVNDGWAVMAYDYCGPVGDRKLFTKYPDKLSYGIMDRSKPKPAAENPLSDPKKSTFYLWYAMERRILSYLARQKEVDKTRLGAVGYSVGGSLMWALGTDPRVKAVVAYFGIGWLDYYRNKSVWLYNNPYVEPPKDPLEKVYLSCLAPEAYVPYMTAATLWLNGSNDHHGGFERGLESFKRFKPGVPWSYAVQARGHHNVERLEQDTKMWLEKYVLGKDVLWPAQPKSSIRLDAEGVPELVVTPANPERVKTVELYYAQKEPCSFGRSWRDVVWIRKGNDWIGKMPVMNIDDYVFGYANIWYDTNVVISSDFNAAIPSRLGKAKATDQKSDVFSAGKDGMNWTDTCETEGVGGVKGFRAFDNRKGTGTANLNDPKWQAPAGSQLSFKFYCTEPQTLILTANDYSAEIAITASDDKWQPMVVPPEKLTRGANKDPMKEWSQVSTLRLAAKAGSDITKVVFAEFKWISK